MIKYGVHDEDLGEETKREPLPSSQKPGEKEGGKEAARRSDSRNMAEPVDGGDVCALKP